MPERDCVHETTEMVIGELRVKYVRAAAAITDLMELCGRTSADLAHYAGTVESEVRTGVLPIGPGEGGGREAEPLRRPGAPG